MLKLELFMDFGKYTIHHLDKNSDSSIHVTSGMTTVIHHRLTSRLRGRKGRRSDALKPLCTETNSRTKTIELKR